MSREESTMEIEKFLGKKYKMERSENVDEILIEMGKRMSKIEKATTTTPHFQRNKFDASEDCQNSYDHSAVS